MQKNKKSYYKTKATQLLDSKGIKCKFLPHKKAVFTCEDAAKERNVPLDEMIKCILLVDKHKNYFLACVTADRRLDTRKIRSMRGCSRLSFASKQEIKEITGYEIGAIPPLALQKDIAIIFDEFILRKKKVNISSGDTRFGLELSPKDLVVLVRPRIGNIASLGILEDKLL